MALFQAPLPSAERAAGVFIVLSIFAVHVYRHHAGHVAFHRHLGNTGGRVGKLPSATTVSIVTPRIDVPTIFSLAILSSLIAFAMACRGFLLDFRQCFVRLGEIRLQLHDSSDDHVWRRIIRQIQPRSQISH